MKRMFATKDIVKMAFGTRHKSTANFQEVHIPVPWGHIAGKWWGPQDKRPILTMHGWQDNCGSFDLLIPTLPNHLSYLAIDFAGHGHSSKLPPGMFYHGVNGVILIRTIQNYFGWKKMSLMGHSMGALTAYTYGFIYPDTVDFMVCIDGLQPLVQPDPVGRAKRNIELFLKFDAQFSGDEEGPSYTMDEMSEKLHLGTRKSIDLDKCKYILERNIKPSATNPGKFYFDRDPRLKCGNLLSWALKDLEEAAGNVTFPLFLSIAEKTPFHSQHDYYKNTFETLKKLGEKFDFHRVPGRHHGHLNEPEILTDLISKFILKYDKEDRSHSGFREEIVAKCINKL